MNKAKLERIEALPKCPVSKPQLRTLKAIYVDGVLNRKKWVDPKQLNDTHPASTTALIAGGYLRSNLTEDAFGAFLITVEPTAEGLLLVSKYG